MNSYYYYDDTATLAMLGMFYVIYLLVVLGYSVVAYILTARGLHTVARRRGIKNPWLAWVPVGNYWIVGSISDQYRYVTSGQVSNRRKILLWLSAVTFAIALVMIAMAVHMAVSTIAYRNTQYVSSALWIVFLSFALMAVSITATVFYYMSLYDYYASCRPANKVLFLLLSIFLGVPMPFFVFACRNDDLGMPPRNDRQMPPPSQPVWPNQPPQIPGQF